LRATKITNEDEFHEKKLKTGAEMVRAGAEPNYNAL